MFALDMPQFSFLIYKLTFDVATSLYTWTSATQKPLMEMIEYAAGTEKQALLSCTNLTGGSAYPLDSNLNAMLVSSAALLHMMHQISEIQHRQNVPLSTTFDFNPCHHNIEVQAYFIVASDRMLPLDIAQTVNVMLNV